MLALPDIVTVLVATILTFGAALGLLWVLSMEKTPPQEQAAEPLTLLFDKGILHHATQRAANLLNMVPGQHDWSDLRDALIVRFPDFPENMANETRRSLTSLDSDGPHAIDIRSRDNLVWVTLRDALFLANRPDSESEIASLRRAAQTAPTPIWEEDRRGAIVWHNAAYAKLHSEVLGRTTDSQTRLFSQVEGSLPNHVAVTRSKDASRDWFELKAVQAGAVTVYHATSINAVIAAEDAQRNFVQTLAKTFAHLSIGLAVFDRDGQLVLFNPALVDLTGLNAPFLSARPTMLSFFDALRENRRMQEPKNYKSWREEIADLIAAATDGHYSETWTLETGQTYNVTGRQHPDGATAFLIEDVSAEMTLTRNFRTELEQAQMMVNAVEDAMAMFLPSGVLTLSNAAFSQHWEIDPEAAFADMTVHDCARIWKAACLLGKDMADLDRALTGAIIGSTQKLALTQKSGRVLQCEVTHLACGSLLVRFRAETRTQDQGPLRLSETA